MDSQQRLPSGVVVATTEDGAHVIFREDDTVQNLLLVIRNGSQLDRALGAEMCSNARALVETIMDTPGVRVVVHNVGISAAITFATSVNVWGQAILESGTTVFVDLTELPTATTDRIFRSFIHAADAHSEAINGNDEVAHLRRRMSRVFMREQGEEREDNSAGARVSLLGDDLGDGGAGRNRAETGEMYRATIVNEERAGRPQEDGRGEARREGLSGVGELGSAGSGWQQEIVADEVQVPRHDETVGGDDDVGGDGVAPGGGTSAVRQAGNAVHGASGGALNVTGRDIGGFRLMQCVRERRDGFRCGSTKFMPVGRCYDCKRHDGKKEGKDESHKG